MNSMSLGIFWFQKAQSTNPNDVLNLKLNTERATGHNYGKA